MSKVWDDLLKLLVRENPQQFVSFVFGGRDVQFEDNHDTELKVRTIHADILYNISLEGSQAILHVEFQRRRDKQMGRRVWEYNASATFLYNVPVYSFVMYLRPDELIVEPPFAFYGPDKTLINVFYYENIKLWEIEADMLKQKGLESLLPLLPLTKHGARRDTVEEMIALLLEHGQRDLLPLGYACAALVFEQGEELQWLKERFASMQEIFEESWAYREMVEKGITIGLERGLKEGKKEGKKEGIEEGIVQGHLEEARYMLIETVSERFPALVGLAEQQASMVGNLTILRSAVRTLFHTSTEEQARRVLVQMAEKS